MGGVGGHQVGMGAVSELLTAAVRTLNYETWDADTLAATFGDELGFTVELETLTRQIDGETDEMSLRATSVYQRQPGTTLSRRQAPIVLSSNAKSSVKCRSAAASS
jgi:hypothetical protein